MMASKKQQREKAAQEYEDRIRDALRWSGDAPTPDVPAPTDRSITIGWMFNVYAQRVDVACSGAVSHALVRTDRTTTQGSRALFSTRNLALRALRAALERKFAEDLARIDVLLDHEAS
jgi:hypothetical protein